MDTISHAVEMEMKLTGKTIYCGPPGMGIRQMLGLKENRNIYSYFEHDNLIYYHKGRTAIRVACELLALTEYDEVLAPAYNCGSEIDALLKSGASVTLYRVDKTGSADIDDILQRISKKTRAIYLTHYFGFPQSVEEVKKICDARGIFLIEDCALALLSGFRGRKIGTSGDVAIYSFPKYLPVPDGGALLINNKGLGKISSRFSNPQIPKIIRAMLPLIKSAFLRSWERHIPLPQKVPSTSYDARSMCYSGEHRGSAMRPAIPSEYYYDELSYDKEMSWMTATMLATFDVESIISKRRKNYEMINNVLSKELSSEPMYKDLPAGVCPLNYPLIVENREYVRSHLRAMNIDAGAWWKGYHNKMSWNEYPDACFLKNNVITLPVHQDLNKHDMSYIADVLLNVIKQKR